MAEGHAPNFPSIMKIKKGAVLGHRPIWHYLKLYCIYHENLIIVFLEVLKKQRLAWTRCYVLDD